MAQRILDLRDTAEKRTNVAVVVDLENLLHDLREQEDWDGAGLRLAEIILEAKAHGNIVYGVACGDRRISREVAFILGELGIRTHSHFGGSDAADIFLIRRLRSDIPGRCNTVMIVSGDHIFAPEVTRLRAEGLRVIVVGLRGHISRELLEAADDRLEIDPAEMPTSSALAS